MSHGRRQRPVPVKLAMSRFRNGADLFRKDVMLGLAIRAAMEKANDEVMSKYRGRSSEAVHTYRLIANGLALHLLLVVSRLYDHSAGRPIQKQNKASLPVRVRGLRVSQSTATCSTSLIGPAI